MLSARPGRLPFWLWLNLLSLDAPLVALVWQDFLARCYPSMLRLPGRYVLGLTVWAIYLADRLLDVNHPVAGNESTRHRFYRRHRRPALVLLVIVLLADEFVAFFWLRPAVFWNGIFTGAAVAAYLAIFSFRRNSLGGLWKQASAAILFTTGVFLVAWTGTSQALRNLGGPALMFAALCLANLLLIEHWEQKRGSRLWPWLLAFALICILAGGQQSWRLAIAASAAALAVLELWGLRLSEDARRVLADAVLLTPLFFLL